LALIGGALISSALPIADWSARELPGHSYIGPSPDSSAEVIVPLNREGGNSTGFRAQLLFFLDDLIPKLFDKPLLSDKPDRSLIAWH